MVAALFWSTADDDFSHAAHACCADDDGFFHAHGFECYDAEGFIVAWKHCYVAGCVVDDAFFFWDEVKAEFDVVALVL